MRKINKIDKPLAKLTRNQRYNIQNDKIRNEIRKTKAIRLRWKISTSGPLTMPDMLWREGRCKMTLGQ